MVQYFNASVRGMQGVAAKNDASYDLSRARASVTGQTTIAASTAATSLPERPDRDARLPGTDTVALRGPLEDFRAGRST